MNSSFLALADLILFLRAPLLLSEGLSPKRYWLVKALIELAFLFVSISGGSLLMAAALTVAINLPGMLGFSLHHRQDIVQLLLGALHLGILSVLFSPAFNLHFSVSAISFCHWITSFTAFAPWIGRLAHRKALKMGFGLLLSTNEANLLIRLILDGLKIKPPDASRRASVVEYNRGRVIGFFERALIFGFVINGQYAAVGFTLTAKGFTRFKELNNREFAEYVLVGTLLSSSIAIAIGFLAMV